MPGIRRVRRGEHFAYRKPDGRPLRNRHAAVRGSTLRLRLRGKHGIVNDVSVDDPRVARIVQRCQEMPGQELFEYADEAGEVRSVGSADVNEYLRDAAGADITAK